MAITFLQLQQHFFGEASAIDLREVQDAASLQEIRDAMDRFGVLVFHDQPFTDEEQLDFARRFDGELHMKTGASAVHKSRFGNEALSDISNLDENGEIMASDDRRRQYVLGNRLWHTDASFQDPPGRYSMLHAARGPAGPRRHPVRGHRAAYGAPPRGRCASGSTGSSSTTRSRTLVQTLGFPVLRGGGARAWRGRSTPSFASSPTRAAARSTSPRTPPASSTGPCPREASAS